MEKRPEIQNKRFWNLTNESLRYIAKDAKEAADNLPDCPKTGVWLDEVNDACTVLYHRSKEANPNAEKPEWRIRAEQRLADKKALK